MNNKMLALSCRAPSVVPSKDGIQRGDVELSDFHPPAIGDAFPHRHRESVLACGNLRRDLAVS